MKLSAFLLAIIALYSCAPKTQSESVTSDSTAAAAGFDENNFASYSDLNNYLVSNADAGDIQEIDTTCAIIVNPTEEQVQRMEKEYGEDFATIADDNSFYQSEALLRFDSTNVRVFNAEKRFVRLKGDTKSWLIDLRKEGAPEWNVILFNTRKKPEIISSIDVTYEKIYEYYIQ